MIPRKAVPRQPRVSKIVRDRTHALCMQHCNLHRSRIVVGRGRIGSPPVAIPPPREKRGCNPSGYTGGGGDGYVLYKHLHA